MRRHEITDLFACHAWAAIIPAALSLIGEVMKQPPQGQTQKPGQNAYTPTAVQQQPGSAADSLKLSDIYKQPGPEATTSAIPSDGSAGLGNIGSTPGQGMSQNPTAQTAHAM